MASAFVIPPEIIDFRPVMKNVDEYIMVLEMRCKKETFTVISLPLELWPEGWQLGCQYSLGEFINMLR